MNSLCPTSLAIAFFLPLVPGCWISDVDPNAEDGPEEQAIPARSDPDTQIAKLLRSKTVSLDLVDTSLDAVIQSLEEQSGAMIVVDPVVYSAKTWDELRVTLMVDEIPLGEALSLVVWLTGCYLKEMSAYLLVTTEPPADLRVIDVRDLVDSFDSRDIRLVSGSDESLPPMQEEVQEGDAMTCDRLISLVRNELPWGNWDCPPNQISCHQGNLIVRNTPDVIERVVAIIERLREGRLRQERLRQLG